MVSKSKLVNEFVCPCGDNAVMLESKFEPIYCPFCGSLIEEMEEFDDDGISLDDNVIDEDSYWDNQDFSDFR